MLVVTHSVQMPLWEELVKPSFFHSVNIEQTNNYRFCNFQDYSSNFDYWEIFFI